MSSTKRRNVGLDALRVLAALMVAGAHFDTALPSYLNYGNYPRPMLNGLGTHLFDGSLAVAIFFLLSGYFAYGSLSRGEFSVHDYYKKRLSRLLVPMWVAWCIGLVFRIYSGSVPVAQGWTIVLTLIGMDGYIPTYIPIRTFGFVGEWYTGAIIVIVLLWPLMRKMLRRSFWGFIFVMMALEIVVGLALPPEVVEVKYWRSPLICMTSHLLGVGLARLAESSTTEALRKKRCLSAVLLVAVGVLVHNVSPLSAILSFQMIAVGFTVIAGELGVGMENREVCGGLAISLRRGIVHCSRISYEFYLFQHIAIYSVLGAALRSLGGTKVYTMTILVIFFAALLVAYGLSRYCVLVEGRIRKLFPE